MYDTNVEDVEEDNVSHMLWEFKEKCEDQKMYDKYACMIQDSKKPTYDVCKLHYRKLATVLEQTWMKQMFGWSDNSVTKLLTFLQEFLFLKETTCQIVFTKLSGLFVH